MCKFLHGLVFGIALVGAQAVMGHTGATGVVKERMELFKAMGKGMKPIVAMMKGKQAFDSTLIAEYSELVLDHSAQLPKKFPEGSLKKPSEALPAIWEENERFLQLFKDLSNEALRLGELALTSDESSVYQQVKATGKACKQCHRDFREEQ